MNSSARSWILHLLRNLAFFLFPTRVIPFSHATQLKWLNLSAMQRLANHANKQPTMLTLLHVKLNVARTDTTLYN